MRPGRVPLLAVALLALLAGLWAGLIRTGWGLPAVRPALAAAHGPLMVSGFLGALIGLERAVALGRRWAYAAPGFAALGILALLAWGARPAAALLMALASIALAAASLAVIRLQPLVFTATMGLGSVSWLAGNLFTLAGWPFHELALWWVGFPTLTIAGERLQLSRIVAATGRRELAFQAVIGLFLAGTVLSVLARGPAVVTDLGWRLAGAGLLGLAVWMLRYDMARYNLRQPGLRRFIGACLLAGQVWLAVGGIIAVLAGALTAGPLYDAFLHAVLLGFVFALIFGHAPIVLPSISGRSVPFDPSFYIPLVLLAASLALRVIGDLAFWPWARSWGALLNAVALLLFLLVTARAVISGNGAGRPA